MTLSGKETTMRRGAYLLALIGMTVHTAVADEMYGTRGPAARAAVPQAAAAVPAGKGAVAPQKFTRSAAAQPNDELRNYYKELFGDTPPEQVGQPLPSNGAGLVPARTTVAPQAAQLPPAQPMAGTSAPAAANPAGVTPLEATPAAVATVPSKSTPATPSVSPAAADAFAKPVTASGPMSFSANGAVASSQRVVLGDSSPDDSKIIHAKFQDQTAPGEQKIQQVNAEAFSARPFPGAPGGAIAEPEFGAFEAKSSSAGTTPAVKTAVDASALQKMEAVEKTAAPVAAATPPATRGSVSFSRTVAPAAPRTSAPAVKPEAEVSSISQTPSVTVEWRKQSDLNVGQECLCHLIVKNAGQTSAKDMEVQAFFPENVRLVGAKPTPAVSDRYLGWKLEELKPGQERTIEITMIPLQRGDVCTRAEVRFSGVATGTFAVAEPMLDVALEGPSQVLIGESAAQIVTVSNPGTGIANHVQIEAIVPDGLEHTRGQRLQMDLGNLNPGESRSVRLALSAAKGGPQRVTVNARAESGLVRSTSADVVVIAPSLETSIQGPGLRYLGRQANYVLSIVNSGEAPTDNVQLRYKVPAGFDFVAADRGAQYDQATGLVTCFVGRMEKGQRQEVKVTLLARQSGEFRHLARASSEHGAIADAEFVTTVEATSSLSVQVKDLEDPVEVGSETTYEIRVKNEGTAGAKGVSLACEMAEGMVLISAEGPSDHRAEASTIVFKSLPEVGAGQTLVFKVKVKSSLQGSLRFRALLSSESVSEPLTAEEMTKFYGE